MPAPGSLDGALLLSLVISTCRALHVAVQAEVRTGLSLPPYGWDPRGGLGGGEPIDLFQGDAPGKSAAIDEKFMEEISKTLNIAPSEEQFVNASLIDPVAIMCCPGDKDGMWYYHVSKPALVPFLAKGAHKDAAVIVAPGGGFQFLAWHKEGTQIAAWLNSLGYHAFVLKYRVPGSIIESLEAGLSNATDTNQRFTGKALIDGQRAVRWLRHNSGRYGVNPKRIGMIGFSAGGILTAELSYTTESQYTYEDEIEAKHYSPRPDFVMLVYSSGKPNSIQAPMPPTFMASAENDQCISAGRVEAYAAALHEAGANPELHLYAEGRHGYGDCTMYIDKWKYHDVCTWPANAEIFLQQVVGKLGAR